MYAKSTRPSAKREVQKERSAKRNDQIALPRRAQNCELRAKRAMRMCPPSGQIFFIFTISKAVKYLFQDTFSGIICALLDVSSFVLD